MQEYLLSPGDVVPLLKGRGSVLARAGGDRRDAIAVELRHRGNWFVIAECAQDNQRTVEFTARNGDALRVRATGRNQSSSAGSVTLTAQVGGKLAAHVLLGVPRSASTEDIDRAYRRLAQRAHPDRGGTAERMQDLNAARAAMLDQIDKGG